MVRADLPKVLVVNGFNLASISKTNSRNRFHPLPNELYPKHIAGTVPFVVDYLNNHRLPVEVSVSINPKSC